MNQQHPHRTSRPVIAVGILMLLIVLGVSMTAFDEPASPNATDTRPATVAQTETAQVSAQRAQVRSGEPETQTAQQAAHDAQGTQAARQGAQEARPQEVSANIARSLTGLIELLNAGKVDEAMAQLDLLMQAETLSQMTPFERSRAYQLSFNLNLQQENYDAARADIEAALESGGLNEQEAALLEYQIAQIFVRKEDYAKAADSLELWIARPGSTPNKDAYYLLAASYYYQERFDDARDHMETLLSMPGENQEGWYTMMASLYLQNEDYARAKPVVEKMVELYGNESYRDQLTGINAELAKTR